MLHSIFDQCNISLNGTSISHSSDNYNYRPLLGRYWRMVATRPIHISRILIGIRTMVILSCYPTDTYTEKTNNGFVRRWNLQKQRKVIEMVRCFHADICNAQTFRVPGVTVNERLTKGRPEFYLMAKEPNSKVTFKILEVRLLVRYIEPNASILYAHNKILDTGALAKYHLMRVEVKTITFAAGSQSLSIDNAVLGTLPKRLLCTFVKNSDFLGTLNSNPYFRHYGIR
jgi:hypothetical protein